MLKFKINYKALLLAFSLLAGPLAMSQYQDKKYLTEFSKDFTDLTAIQLRDAYPVMDAGFMNQLKITSAGASMKKVSSSDLPYKNVIEIQTSKEFSNDWDAEMSAISNKPVLEGDVLVLVFYMRMVSSQAASRLGFTRVYFQKPGPPWDKAFNESVSADGKWRKFQIAYTSPKDFQPGDGGLFFALGYSFQTMQLADIHLLNLGANVNSKDIDVKRFEPEMNMDLAEGEPINISYTVNINEDKKPISPLIYGSNGQTEDWEENITARRLGGNRITSYNWENNASNAGHDYMQNSDNYLLWKNGLLNYEKTPGVVMTAFHDTSVAMKTYTLLTAQMAGYVAADKNGPVDTSEKAPSGRWIEVKFTKGSALSSNPNPTDNYVYMDEMVNYMIKRYGKSNTGTGIKGWALDNEPGLWNSTHPLIHPEKATCDELFAKSKRLASVIKELDPDAEVYGPIAWGYSDMIHFSEAPDWNKYSKKYPSFLSAYLSTMKAASDSTGKRLLDVLALHWYPEARGFTDKNVKERVWRQDRPGEGLSDKGVAIARMQAVRSLWDSTYMEDSWYTKDFIKKPIYLIPKVQSWIKGSYPGTKLAFTEYNFGGYNHISGGIAQADLFGVYAKYDVYFATFWGPLKDYVSSAYKLYRNYDGKRSSFGDIMVKAASTDYINSSIYASVHSTDASKLNLVVLNKNYDHPINATIDISGGEQYKMAKVYAFDNSSSNIKLIGTTEVSDNKITYTFPPLTAAHIVLTK